jgi:hypothetical protein
MLLPHGVKSILCVSKFRGGFPQEGAQIITVAIQQNDRPRLGYI